VPIAPISWKDYKTPALRPPYSVLDARGLITAIQQQPLPWRSSLAQVMDEPP
jgi:dTDP-4-dehydrorhamnose reductase